LRSALCGTTVKAFQVVPHPLERVALLANLPKDSPALRGRITEDREKSGRFAANAARLSHDPIDFVLLAIDHILCTADLLDTRGISIPPVETRELCFKPWADWIRRLCVGRTKRQRSRDKRAGEVAE
jgi:hypothetical protein